MSEDASDDIFRIMITTDNHLGVHESDPIRKDDSFEAFDEVLQKAVDMNADMVLLGGDLFHENKPSRDTIIKAMRILKKHCLNDRPVSFQVLSQQDVNFPSTGRVNYEDPNTNIGLPVFTIHGNHDDPAGAGRLSAVDIMSEASLVNYFGNMDLEGSNIGRLKISPILIQKASTFVALYGLGNVRDERLARLFRTPGSVEWEREDAGKWFTIFTIHQNREKRTPKNSVDEESLPQFLDFILWGHEHQCIPEPQTSSKNESCEILQAGSTVATSLSEGEADPKHCFMLEIMGDNYRVVKHPLESVRPFIYKQLSLANHEELDPENPKSVETFLEEHVSAMIEDAVEDSRMRLGGDIDNPKLPLVRLKVDYTGFSTINVQRFGQRFVNKVANPQDILIFSKHAQRKAAVQQQGNPDINLDSLRPEELDQSRIEDLVAENLGPGASLEVLDEHELQEALHKFVDKDDRHALDVCVKQMLTRFQEKLEREAGDVEMANGEEMDAGHELEKFKVVNQPNQDDVLLSVATNVPVRPEPGSGTVKATNVNRAPFSNNARASSRPATQGTLDGIFKRPARTNQRSETTNDNGFGTTARGNVASVRDNTTPLGDDDDILEEVQITQMSGVRSRTGRQIKATKHHNTPIFSDDEISNPSAGSNDDDWAPNVIETDNAGQYARKQGRGQLRRSTSEALGSSFPQGSSQRNTTRTNPSQTPFSTTNRKRSVRSRDGNVDNVDEEPMVISDDSEDGGAVKPMLVRRRGASTASGGASLQPSNRSAWGAPRS